MLICSPQLALCVEMIARRDFPSNWPTLQEQIESRLEKPDANAWTAALTTIYRIVKSFEWVVLYCVCVSDQLADTAS